MGEGIEATMSHISEIRGLESVQWSRFFKDGRLSFFLNSDNTDPTTVVACCLESMPVELWNDECVVNVVHSSLKTNRAGVGKILHKSLKQFLRMTRSVSCHFVQILIEWIILGYLENDARSQQIINLVCSRIEDTNILHSFLVTVCHRACWHDTPCGDVRGWLHLLNRSSHEVEENIQSIRARVQLGLRSEVSVCGFALSVTTLCLEQWWEEMHMSSYIHSWASAAMVLCTHNDGCPVRMQSLFYPFIEQTLLTTRHLKTFIVRIMIGLISDPDHATTVLLGRLTSRLLHNENQIMDQNIACTASNVRRFFRQLGKEGECVRKLCTDVDANRLWSRFPKTAWVCTRPCDCDSATSALIQWTKYTDVFKLNSCIHHAPFINLVKTVVYSDNKMGNTWIKANVQYVLRIIWHVRKSHKTKAAASLAKQVSTVLENTSTSGSVIRFPLEFREYGCLQDIMHAYALTHMVSTGQTSLCTDADDVCHTFLLHLGSIGGHLALDPCAELAVHVMCSRLYNVNLAIPYGKHTVHRLLDSISTLAKITPHVRLIDMYPYAHVLMILQWLLSNERVVYIPKPGSNFEEFS